MQLTHQQAAFLYLIIYNVEENRLDPKISNDCKAMLGNANFPSEVVYDNEGEPLVKWEELGERSKFEWDQWLYKEKLEEDNDEIIRDYIINAMNMVYCMGNPDEWKRILNYVN